jgi:hypothetical protein
VREHGGVAAPVNVQGEPKKAEGVEGEPEGVMLEACVQESAGVRLW